jgi:thiol:disulfide interchange protein DsbG
MTFQKYAAIAAAVALVPALGFAAAKTVPAKTMVPAMSAGVTLINKVTQNQLSVEKQFKATDGLTGFVLKAKQQPSQQMIFYTNKKGSLLFIGNLINADGKNLTEAYTNQYILAPKAAKAWAQVSTLNYVAQGSNKAPHKTYVFWDPNCSYCHLLYQELQPLVVSGKLQVRWVPVAIRPNSKGKTARILHDAGKGALKDMAADEAHFNMSKEQGSLKPLAQSKSKDVTAAFAKTAANTKMFTDNFVGTPVILFMNTDGKAKVIPGFIQGAQLQATVSSMASKW